MLLDKIAIEQEKKRLAKENGDLRTLIKQYLDGVSVPQDAVDSANPLLIVNGRVNVDQVYVPRMQRAISFSSHSCHSLARWFVGESVRVRQSKLLLRSEQWRNTTERKTIKISHVHVFKSARSRQRTNLPVVADTVQCYEGRFFFYPLLQSRRCCLTRDSFTWRDMPFVHRAVNFITHFSPNTACCIIYMY